MSLHEIKIFYFIVYFIYFIFQMVFPSPELSSYSHKCQFQLRPMVVFLVCLLFLVLVVRRPTAFVHKCLASFSYSYDVPAVRASALQGQLETVGPS